MQNAKSLFKLWTGAYGGPSGSNRRRLGGLGARVRLGTERGDRWGRRGVLTSGREGRGWPYFGEGRSAVMLWRRPVSMHGRHSGVSQVTGGGGRRPARPREAAGGVGFLRRDSMPANRGRPTASLQLRRWRLAQARKAARRRQQGAREWEARPRVYRAGVGVACTARTPRERRRPAQAVSAMDTGGVGDLGPYGLPRADGRAGGCGSGLRYGSSWADGLLPTEQ
jgi:hypothetical protein